MSEENVEIVRGAYDAPFGGEEWLAGLDALVDADFEIEDRTLPEPAPDLKGPAAGRAEAAQLLDALEDVNYPAEDLVDLDDRVPVLVRGSARGKGSGIRINGTLGHLWRLRGGKVVRLVVYATWQEAREAAGLAG
jgi:ketosteroid isomerase-like protein